VPPDLPHRITIEPASSSSQLAHVRTLFHEYAAWLSVDLCFQGFELELASLPGLYAPPRGRLFLALAGAEAAACIALRPLDANVCEMKRLFVRPAFRRTGLGRRLAEHLIADARAIGYSFMRLDTLDHMAPALKLYASLGFRSCPAYYQTPLPNTVFLELRL
jgi:putative acetyltransferase